MSGVYKLTDENFGKKLVEFTTPTVKGVYASTVSNILVAVNFVLIWSSKCDICHNFMPIFMRVASKINNPRIKFSTYEVVGGTKVQEFTKDTLLGQVEGVPTILVFINQIAVQKLQHFSNDTEMLMTVRRIVQNINTVQARVLTDDELRAMSGPAQSQKQVARQEKKDQDERQVNHAYNDAMGLTPVDYVSNKSCMNQCPLDSAMGSVFSCGESMSGQSGKCGLGGYEASNGNGNAPAGKVNYMPNDYQPTHPEKRHRDVMGINDSFGMNNISTNQASNDQTRAMMQSQQQARAAEINSKGRRNIVGV